jgi:hypothetical protein
MRWRDTSPLVATSREEGVTMFRNAELNPEATECHCGTVPLSHLGLDIDEPMSGWPAFFRERNIEVAPDDLGRPSVLRHVLAELLAERREREARLAAQRAEEAATLEAPVPVGVPAGEGLSAFETMVAQPGYQTIEDELGRPKPNFIVEELAEGRRREAAARAEQEAVQRAQRVLEGGRDG